MKDQFKLVPLYAEEQVVLKKVTFTYRHRRNAFEDYQIFTSDSFIEEEKSKNIKLEEHTWAGEPAISFVVTTEEKIELREKISGYKEVDVLPKGWRVSDKGNSLRISDVLIICDKGYYQDEFPMKGKFVVSKQGTKLFFVDESGKNVLSRFDSKYKNRFEENQIIEKYAMESGCIYCTHDKDHRYEVK